MIDTTRRYGGYIVQSKHSLTQEVAYKSVLVERRKIHHERIGSAMEASFAQSIDDHLSQLAYHHGRGSNIAKASTHRNNDFPFSASTFDVG